MATAGRSAEERTRRTPSGTALVTDDSRLESASARSDPRLPAAGRAVCTLHAAICQSAEPPEGAEPSDAPPPWEGGSPPLPRLWEVLRGQGMGSQEEAGLARVVWGALGALGGSPPRTRSEADPAGTASRRDPLQRRRRAQQEQALPGPRPQPGALPSVLRPPYVPQDASCHPPCPRADENLVVPPLCSCVPHSLGSPWTAAKATRWPLNCWKLLSTEEKEREHTRHFLSGSLAFLPVFHV